MIYYFQTEDLNASVDTGPLSWTLCFDGYDPEVNKNCFYIKI